MRWRLKVDVGSTFKRLVISSVAISCLLCIYAICWGTGASNSHERCSDDGFIQEHPIDRRNRIAHLASLDSLASKIEHLYSQTMSSCSPTPIIYDCSSSFQECGGLGDRLKGMASTFYLGLLTNSRFYYQWSFPTELDSYFVPPNSTSVLSSPASTARSLMGWKYLDMFEWWCMNWHCMVRDLDRTTSSDLAQLWRGYSSVISHTNMAYWDLMVRNRHLSSSAKRYNLHHLPQDEMFYLFIKLYFSRLSTFMEHELEPYGARESSNNTASRVGLQLRVGNDTAWQEGARHSLAAVACFVGKAREKCEEEAQKGRECVVFVSTDSDAALHLFEERLRALGLSMVVTKGRISHIDKPEGWWLGRKLEDKRSAIRAHSRVFVDWWLLRGMDYLFISRSGFAESAAFADMVPAERMLVRDERSCRFFPWTGEAGAKLW